MAVYGLVMRALQPMLRRKLQRRGQQEPGYLHQVSQRFGVYDTPVTSGAIWVHAVSLGETRAAALLVDALRQQWPGMRLLLTHSTATGWRRDRPCSSPVMCKLGCLGTHPRPPAGFCNTTNRAAGC